jgi:hypothetical protein
MSSRMFRAPLQASLGQPGERLPGVLALLLCAGLAWPLALAAQTDEDAEDTGDSSQHVEESEEAYRRRMETQDGMGQTDVIPDRPATGGTTGDGIDDLPFESRKHLRDEMRNVIMEQGEWQPEDATKTYPYHPSAGAQADPELRQKEEKAWGELVAEYHKREAAALAGGSHSGGPPPGGQSGGQGGGQSGGQAGNQAGAKAKSGGSATPNSQASRSPGTQPKARPEARPEAEAAGSTAAGAGVSQSALEFLKGQTNGQAGGQPGSPSGGQPGGQPQPQSADQVAVASPSSEAAAAQQQKADDATKDPSQEKSGKEGEEAETPPPGSIAIAELEALEKSQRSKAEAAEQAQARSNAEADPAEAEPSNTVVLRSSPEDENKPRPGTIAIPELEKLKGVDDETP